MASRGEAADGLHLLGLPQALFALAEGLLGPTLVGHVDARPDDILDVFPAVRDARIGPGDEPPLAGRQVCYQARNGGVCCHCARPSFRANRRAPVLTLLIN